MISESRILEAFAALLGDRYIIIPKEKEEMVAMLQELLGDEYEVVPKEPIEGGDDQSDTDDESDWGGQSDSKKDKSVLDNQDDIEDETDLDAEARALFERDKQKSEYFRHRDDEQSKEKATENISYGVAEIQRVYGSTQKQIKDEIKRLEQFKNSATAERRRLVQDEDKDNPFLLQMLTAYDVDKINERIDTLIRIKSDPFFGRYVLEKQNGEKVDVFVGTHDFQNGSIQIISTWSPVGRAFQQNLTNFEIGVTKYRVLEKYIYAVNHNRIVSIKNESPR